MKRLVNSPKLLKTLQILFIIFRQWTFFNGLIYIFLNRYKFTNHYKLKENLLLGSILRY